MKLRSSVLFHRWWYVYTHRNALPGFKVWSPYRRRLYTTAQKELK